MGNQILDFEKRRLERDLSRIGALIAEASDSLKRIRELSEGTELLLINAQRQIESAYLSLDGESEE